MLHNSLNFLSSIMKMFTGVDSNDLLKYAVIIVAILACVFLFVRVEGVRWFAVVSLVLVVGFSGVYSGIKLNQYYSAEGGIYGKIDDLLKNNEVTVEQDKTRINFNFKSTNLTEDLYGNYSAHFQSSDVIKLDSTVEYFVLVNDMPCQIIEYDTFHFIAEYYYSFYSIDGSYILTDKLTFTFAFSQNVTDLYVSTSGGTDAVDLWNVYFSKNDFIVNFETTDYVYSSSSNMTNLFFYVDDTLYANIEVDKNNISYSLENPTKENCTFVGWSLDGETLIDDINTAAVTEPVTYIAVFEEIANYSFTIQDVNTSYFGQGVYSTFTSLNYPETISSLDVSTNKASSDLIVGCDKVYENSSVYAVVLPYNAGHYISRVYVLYTIPGDTEKTLECLLSFDQTTHLLTFDGTSTSYGAFDNVFEDFEIINGCYNDSSFVISDDDVNSMIEFNGYLKDYAYICFKFTNLKADIRMGCEYVAQRYKLTSYTSYCIDELLGPVSPYMDNLSTVVYGTTLRNACNPMDTYLVEPAYYLNSICDDNLLSDELLDSYVTVNTIVYALYDLHDLFDNNRIYYYTMDIDNSIYSLNSISSDYILQGVDAYLAPLDCSDITFTKLGLICTASDTEGQYTWSCSSSDYASNFVFNFVEGGEYYDLSSLPITNEYSSIYSYKLKSIPTIDVTYNIYSSFGFIYFTIPELVSSINHVLGYDKYTTETIHNLFDEDICFHITSVLNGNITINIECDESCELYGKTITAPKLTTSCELTESIVAIQVFM